MFERQAGSVPGAEAAQYVARDPFDNISSLTFDGSPNENRYLVRIPEDRAAGGGIPARIKVDAESYPLTNAYTADAGVAVFRTQKSVDPSVRVDAHNPSRNIDVQYADGTWASGAGKRQVIRTLDRPSLQQAANSAPEVTYLPRAPVLNQRVKLVAPDTLAGYGILKAASAAGGFAGYQAGPPESGSLTGAPANRIELLGSYAATSTGRFRDVAVVAPKRNSGKTPQAVWINDRRYAVTTSDQRFWQITGADGSTFVAGRTYRVQVLWADNLGTILGPEYPDKDFQSGDFTWKGPLWMRTSVPGLTRVYDGQIGGDGFSITNDSEEERDEWAAFSPSFDLDLVANGAFSSQLELTIKPESRTNITIAFDEHYTLKYREGAMTTVAAIKEQAVYTSGAVEGKGVVVAATPIYNGSDKLGDLRLYLARNPSHELGYLLDYARVTSSASGKQLTVTARLTLNYQPYL